MLPVKPAEDLPSVRYVIRNTKGLFYDGHDESGWPTFTTRDIYYAGKFGDLESIDMLIKNHKKFCIDKDLPGDLYDSCEIVTTHT